MIQAIGLTSASRPGGPPAVDDLTFEAGPGAVTVLLGPPGAGKSAALRLMLQLAPGRGVALFRGRPLSRVPHPQREIGVLLGDLPGHPGRSARGHLRMLAAAAGVPAERADEVLEVVGLSGVADQRLGRFSRGMDRRLGLAAALLGDPHTLVLDEPDNGLSPRERAWLHGLLRGYVEQGGAVLLTATDAMEAARVADRVVSVDAGRLVADQHASDFSRTRLRPRVVVRTPHAERLATLLRHRLGASGPVEVAQESGNRLAVYGGDLAAVGEVAHQHRIVVHQLADEVGDVGDRAPLGPLHRADGRPATVGTARRESPATVILTPGAGAAAALAGQSAAVRVSARSDTAVTGEEAGEAGAERTTDRQAERGQAESAVRAAGPATDTLVAAVGVALASPVPDRSAERADAPRSTGGWERPAAPAGDPPTLAIGAPARGGSPQPRPALPPPLPVLPPPGPSWPLRYELRRWAGVRSSWWIMVLALVAGLVAAVALACAGSQPAERVLTGWAEPLPLPPVALAAGLLGALAFGQEFRYPALAATGGQVPRRLSLLVGKLLVTTGCALALCAAVVVVDSTALTLLLGTRGPEPASWGAAFQSVAALSVGCAWAGLLAAGVFRSGLAGLAAVAAVPLVLAPALRAVLDSPLGERLDGLPERFSELTTLPFAAGLDRWLSASAPFASPPVGWALVLSLALLLGGYALLGLRGGPR
ncbi:ATP-binding cassette domain-containing protein [Streptomyces sp. DSM 44915]|uniref:ATP-binding cassette domain-containing protein n=1 Tax=Streptomyces chisholmiae TaxID=3075540 RepID=A0ABU2JMI2_9ACTN|nr:ATP-binding cassette domain-containing protein [Streptomyces sp. DSM 44915]MDT0266193.1 ATP-binding cassette domain-containing protein [Streptomyces sp. DSM 44915]